MEDKQQSEADVGDIVEVCRYVDLPSAEMARSLLEAEGIHAFVSGDSARGVLPLTGAIELIVRVPEARAEEARALLMAAESELRRPSAEEGGDTAPSEESQEEPAGGPPALSPRSARVAVAVAFFLPGAANIYARHGVLGATLLVAFIGNIFAFPVAGFVAWPIVILADIILGLGSVRRANAGKPLHASQQVFIGLMVWALAAVASWGLSPA